MRTTTSSTLERVNATERLAQFNDSERPQHLAEIEKAKGGFWGMIRRNVFGAGQRQLNEAQARANDAFDVRTVVPESDRAVLDRGLAQFESPPEHFESGNVILRPGVNKNDEEFNFEVYLVKLSNGQWGLPGSQLQLNRTNEGVQLETPAQATARSFNESGSSAIYSRAQRASNQQSVEQMFAGAQLQTVGVTNNDQSDVATMLSSRLISGRQSDQVEMVGEGKFFPVLHALKKLPMHKEHQSSLRYVMKKKRGNFPFNPLGEDTAGIQDKKEISEQGSLAHVVEEIFVDEQDRANAKKELALIGASYRSHAQEGEDAEKAKLLTQILSTSVFYDKIHIPYQTDPHAGEAVNLLEVLQKLQPGQMQTVTLRLLQAHGDLSPIAAKDLWRDHITKDAVQLRPEEIDALELLVQVQLKLHKSTTEKQSIVSQEFHEAGSKLQVHGGILRTNAKIYPLAVKEIQNQCAVMLKIAKRNLRSHWNNRLFGGFMNKGLRVAAREDMRTLKGAKKELQALEEKIIDVVEGGNLESLSALCDQVERQVKIMQSVVERQFSENDTLEDKTDERNEQMNHAADVVVAIAKAMRTPVEEKDFATQWEPMKLRGQGRQPKEVVALHRKVKKLQEQTDHARAQGAREYELHPELFAKAHNIIVKEIQLLQQGAVGVTRPAPPLPPIDAVEQKSVVETADPNSVPPPPPPPVVVAPFTEEESEEQEVEEEEEREDPAAQIQHEAGELNQRANGVFVIPGDPVPTLGFNPEDLQNGATNGPVRDPFYVSADNRFIGDTNTPTAVDYTEVAAVEYPEDHVKQQEEEGKVEVPSFQNRLLAEWDGDARSQLQGDLDNAVLSRSPERMAEILALALCPYLGDDRNHEGAIAWAESQYQRLYEALRSHLNQNGNGEMQLVNVHRVCQMRLANTPEKQVDAVLDLIVQSESHVNNNPSSPEDVIAKTQFNLRGVLALLDVSDTPTHEHQNNGETVVGQQDNGDTLVQTEPISGAVLLEECLEQSVSSLAVAHEQFDSQNPDTFAALADAIATALRPDNGEFDNGHMRKGNCEQVTRCIEGQLRAGYEGKRFRLVKPETMPTVAELQQASWKPVSRTDYSKEVRDALHYMGLLTNLEDESVYDEVTDEVNTSNIPWDGAENDDLDPAQEAYRSALELFNPEDADSVGSLAQLLATRMEINGISFEHDEGAVQPNDIVHEFGVALLQLPEEATHNGKTYLNGRDMQVIWDETQGNAAARVQAIVKALFS